MYESDSPRDGRGHSLQSIAKAQRITPQVMLGTQMVPEEISKRARRYDPEADRQRRMGLYAGAGAGGSALAAREAARALKDAPADKVRHLKIPKAKSKAGGLVALSALLGSGGVAAYRHGISRRNQPYN